MNEFAERYNIKYRYEEIHNYEYWAHNVPAFHFDKEWDVKIIPPFMDAIIRFTIDYKGKHISVYLDALNALGYFRDENNEVAPYFEYFDGDECYRYGVDESEKMMDDIRKFLNSEVKVSV